MKQGWKRFSALLLVVMMLASSQANVWADIQSTPVVEPTQEVEDNNQSSSNTPEAQESGTVPASETPVSDDDLDADDPAVQPLANISNYSIGALSYDAVTGNVTIPLTFSDGFSGSKEDSLTLNWNGDGATFEMVSFVSASSNEFDVEFDADNQALRLELVDDLTVSGSDLVLTLIVGTTITWDACTDTPSGYPTSAWGTISDSVDRYTSGMVEVTGPPCPGTGIPEVYSTVYTFGDQSLYVSMLLPKVFAPNAIVTITYPADQLVVSPQPVPVYAYDYGQQRSVQIGTVEAADGVITITFNEASTTGVWAGFIDVTISASLIYSCENDQATADIDQMTFVAVPGLTSVQKATTVLCNAEAPSKSGAWSTDDEGNDVIVWTVDSGDLFSGGSIYDSVWMATGDTMFTFDCDSLQVELLSGDDYDVQCYPDYPYFFAVDLYGDTPVRGIVTINAYPEDGFTSYVNCASVSSGPSVQGFSVASTATGWGGFPCFELFPDGGGDSITKSVDKETARSGDTVTYTVVATTTSDRWQSVTLTDPLPEGFTLDPASVTCVVDGEEYASDPCYTLDGNTLTVTALPASVDMDGWIDYQSGPATITLTFNGIVTGEPGDTITNQACSERTLPTEGDQGPKLLSVGDPTIPGGGVICATASTRILGAVTPAPVTFVDFDCDVTPQVVVPEDGNGISYTIEGDVERGGTVTVYATLDSDINTWGDLTGTGWTPVDGQSHVVSQTFHISDKDCRTPVVPIVTFTEATCTSDAKAEASPVTGVGYGTVTEIGAGKTYILYATIDLTKNVWGDLTGTGWVPVDGDPSSVRITHTFADAPDCTTPSPSPTVPAATPTEPGATPTEPGATATATATQGVTGLPNTGSGSGNIGTVMLWSALGMIVSSAVLAGIRIRRTELDR